MVAESWFRNLWKTKKKHEPAGPEKAVIGILASEVASLMSKMVHLWRSLSDKKVARLRDNISNSEGIKKLVSDDDDFIVGKIYIELFENMVNLAKSVARLGKKHCTDPSLKGFEYAISDLIDSGVDPYGWEFSWKMMKIKAKRMQKFISVNEDLRDEMKVLSDLEQTLEVITTNLDGEILLDFQQKVEWKRQEVENLKEISLWNNTFDDVVLLLARSLFTTFGRIKKLEKDSDHITRRCHSVSSVHPFEEGPIAAMKRTIRKVWKSNSLSEVGPFRNSPVTNCYLRWNTISSAFVHVDRDANINADILASDNKLHTSPSIFSYKHKLLYAPPETLGAAALALHYANVVIEIEKSVQFPSLMVFYRDNLYKMLPATVRNALRKRLEPDNSKSSTSSVCDEGVSGEWNEAVSGILEWLAPLSHNMISWKPKNRHVLLVQTLYFANQQKTEATITELLVGLHYMWKFRYHVLSIPKQLLSPQISGLQKDQDPDGESNTAAVDAKQQLRVLRTNLKTILIQGAGVTSSA